MWHDVLAGNGFSGIDLTFGDYESAVYHELDIMISSAVKPPPDQHGSLNVVNVADIDSNFQRELSLACERASMSRYTSSGQSFDERTIMRTSVLSS